LGIHDSGQRVIERELRHTETLLNTLMHAISVDKDIASGQFLLPDRAILGPD
jgi:hypothetical protein